MVTNYTPTAADRTRVRGRLRQVSETAYIDDDILDDCIEDAVVEIELYSGDDYSSSDRGHVATMTIGSAYWAVLRYLGGMLESKAVMLGDLRVENQGLNWNIGTPGKVVDELKERFYRMLDMVSAGRFAMVNTISGNPGDTLSGALSNIKQR